MYIKDIVFNVEEYIGKEVVCSGELMYENNQFYIVSTIDEQMKLTLLVDEHMFTFINYIKLKNFGKEDKKREIVALGVVLKNNKGHINIEPTYINVYGSKQNFYFFRKSVDIAQAFPSSIEYQDISQILDLSKDRLLAIPIEATLIGIMSNDRSKDTKFYLTAQKIVEIEEPYIVDSKQLIEIADKQFLSNYTKIVSVVIPSPTPWINRVRLTADIQLREDGTYSATNILDVYIRISNTFYKQMK